VQSTAVAKSLEEEGVVSLLTPPTVPPPVFLCTVEPSSSANQKNLEEALLILSREDPSLRVTFDSDTGQTVLSGMGELHLEVVEERLKRVFGVECELGQLQVAYRESLLQETLATAALNRAIGSSKHSVFARVGLYPREPGTGVSVRFGSEVKMEKSVTRVLSSVVETSLTRGPLLGFPVEGVSVCVEELTGDGVALLSACLAQAVQKALEVAEIGLLEPLTQLEIVVPEQFVGVVLSDLTSARRAQVQCLSEGVGGERTVLAQVPLATLLGYAKHLRSMTSGSASFTMLSAGHLQMDNHQQNAVVKQIRGY
jgi:elongation factor G